MRTIWSSVGKVAVCAGALLVFAGSAQAATIYASTVESASRGDALIPGTGGTTNRADTGNALGAADGFFFSIGAGALTGTGDEVIVSFGQSFIGPSTIVEITGGSRTDYDESVEILVSATLAGVYTSMGTITNDLESTSVVISGGPWAFMKLLDSSTETSGTPDGWDVDSISVQTVPIPAAAWLFGSGLIGLMAVARRKKA